MSSTQSTSGGARAPLPSPDARTKDATQYFAPLHASAGALSIPGGASGASTDVASSADTSRSNSTRVGGSADYLGDFTLVAEAARRAQMAVVTRDLEDVSL